MQQHRAVESGPVPVVVAVHLGGFIAMGQLEESARRAPHELKRTLADMLLRGGREDAGQSLLSKIEDSHEIR
jgi:hypothetical protein